MNCCKCKSIELQLMKTKNGIWIDYCSNCEGIWLDKGEIYCFTKKQDALRKEIENALLFAKSSDRTDPSTYDALKEISLYGEWLIADYNPLNGGMWFDKGELEKLTGLNKSDLIIEIDENASKDKPKGAIISDVAELPPQVAWSILTITNNIANIKNNIYVHENSKNKPDKISSMKSFLGRTWDSIKLTLQEKEIIMFSLFQWGAVAIAYIIWVQMLGWIPDEVWESAKSSNRGRVVNVVLLAWSFVCVGLAALPIGVFSACMGAVHFLRLKG